MKFSDCETILLLRAQIFVCRVIQLTDFDLRLFKQGIIWFLDDFLPLMARSIAACSSIFMKNFILFFIFSVF